VVAGIVPRSPAESGIREGDLIQALNFREVANRQGLYRELWKHAAGATIRVAIVRKGQSLTIAVTIADRAEFFL
jgi:serine protease Do